MLLIEHTPVLAAAPDAPLALPLPRRVGNLVRSAAMAALRGWRHGQLTFHFSDGTSRAVGDRESTDRAAIRVADDRLFLRALLRGELGAGESFAAGEWDSDDLVGAVRLFLRNLPALRLETPLARLAMLPTRVVHAARRNAIGQSAKNIRAHYDLGNEFYALMLDPTMAYSCALFATPGESLEAAQRNKFERACERLALGATDHVLEIGCGWGGFAIHAATTRGCRVTAITVSHEQYQYALAAVRSLGIESRVEVLQRDYREVRGRFTKIVSLEMLEAVGHEYYDTFFARCAELLGDDGAMFVQTIAMPDHRYESYRRSVDWTQAYIFPGVLIPSLAALTAAMARASDFSVQRLEDIGLHYAPTLRAWRNRFEQNIDRVRALGFDATFERRWRLYLSFSEAAFAERDLSDLQILFTRPRHPGFERLPR